MGMGGPLWSIHFKEETISLCHPERSEGSLSGERSFAALRMTLLKRLRLTRKTSSLKCIAPKPPPVAAPLDPASSPTMITKIKENYTPQRSAGVCTGASQYFINSSLRRNKVMEQPAISKEVM